MRASKEGSRARSTRAGAAAVAAAMVLGALGCNEYGIPAGTSPHREFNFLDMGDQPKVKAQRGDLHGGPSFMPAPGSIPRGFEPYRYHGQPEVAAQKLTNPLPEGNAKVLERGKLMFERYCVPCHADDGSGKGLVIEKGFPAPPSLLTQKLRDWSDGHIYHVVTDGQNIMPSYATQIRPEDRWAAVRYVRDLQSRLPVAPPPENAAPEGSGSAPAAPPPADSAVPPADSAAPAGSAAPADSAAPPASAAPPEAASAAPANSAPAPGEVK